MISGNSISGRLKILGTLAIVVLTKVLFSNAALAELVPFSELPMPSVEERVERMLNFLRAEDAYKNASDDRRAILFRSAASIIAERFCATKSSDGKLITYPKWYDPIAGSWYDTRSLPTDGTLAREVRLLSWSLIGLMADDEYPCEIAEFFDKSAGILH